MKAGLSIKRTDDKRIQTYEMKGLRQILRISWITKKGKWMGFRASWCYQKPFVITENEEATMFRSRDESDWESLRKRHHTTVTTGRKRKTKTVMDG